MSTQVLNLTYESSLTNLCSINPSFDTGVLRIAYAGANRNGSFISKETFEKCIKSIFNCPIVCNYDRETDTLGGHDMETVRDSDGNLKLINLTTPVGCIPESANVFWEKVEEENGVIHEYLCADALLWKRQEAYSKIKKDGIVSQSMEIQVLDGELQNGLYVIKNFNFTAFALIGVEPCFESASLELFAQTKFKEEFSQMMNELKESFSAINGNQATTTTNTVTLEYHDATSHLNTGDGYSGFSDIGYIPYDPSHTYGYRQYITGGDQTGYAPSHEERDTDNITHTLTEGGEQDLEKKEELMAKYGVDKDALEFAIDELTLEELETKLKDAGYTLIAEEGDNKDKYALIGNLISEIALALSSVKIQKEWGEMERYWYVDFDNELQEVYCWDAEDWLLYGFKYTMNGDNVVIDFESKKRKKFVIEDFDEGEQPSPVGNVFSNIEQKFAELKDIEQKYQEASQRVTAMESDLNALREFKIGVENEKTQAAKDSLFEQFSDLNGVEAFEELKSNNKDYDISALEEKCYAIRGRQGVSAKFAKESKMPKIVVERTTDRASKPYGDLFEKYGYQERN